MKCAFKSAVISIAALFMVLTLWLSFAGKPVSAAVADEDTITVDVNDKMQEWDGWGTALAWWANNYGGRTDRVGGIEYRKQIANMIFSDQGLNLNIARYNLGTPYNPEIDPNWNSLSNGASYGQLCMNPLKMNKDDPFDWTMDSSQIWMLEEFYRQQGDRAKAITSCPSNTRNLPTISWTRWNISRPIRARKTPSYSTTSSR